MNSHIPYVGSRWRDYKIPTRILHVSGIDFADPMERNVVGTVSGPGQLTYSYSCSLKTFQLIWRPL